MTLRGMLLGLLWIIVCVGACSGVVQGQQEDWEAKAQQSGLSETDVTKLTEHRLLVTNEAYKQVFEAYLDGENPLFITSDSLLNAYHVLYEESILRLETARATRLPGILKLILNNLDLTDDHVKGNSALVTSARRRARLVPGIAMRLLDDSFRFKDEELDTIVDREAQKVLAASGGGKPQWLGPFDAAFLELDYTRYKPRGFYTRSETLQRYFRAVAWLQSIPFRIRRDEELLAILMLGNSVTGSRFDDYDKKREVEEFFTAYRFFIGAGDDWDIMAAAHEAQHNLLLDLASDVLQKKRSRLKERAEFHGKGPLINDQIRCALADPNKAAELTFRILSAYRTPGAILFQRTTDIRRFGDRPYPNGLEVAVSLGSPFARERLNSPQKEQVLATIDTCQRYFKGDSLYFEYLDALRALLDEPESDAPDFMKNQAWQAKSCNAVLAGWSQLRHTWILQAKQTVCYLCATETPVGFVEPEPEFFSRMADLGATTRGLLRQSGAFDPDYTMAVESLTKLKGLIDGVKTIDELAEKFDNLEWEEGRSIELGSMLVSTRLPGLRHSPEVFLAMGPKCIDGLLEDIERGRIADDSDLAIAVQAYAFDLDVLWERFVAVSRRLESIAHKQLRGADLNDSETRFIRSYGKAIAGVMLYGGNAYMNPDDDAPRVADVFFNPEQARSLHVGIARPRKLYVLYPWHGQTVLCQGAVLPYYEFTSAERLTDESWMRILDSDKRPSVPDWMRPLISGRDLARPKLQEDH